MSTATASNPTSASSASKAADLLPDATIIQWLKDMYLIREFENRTAQAYQQAKIGGFCHLYIGQEATAVGTINALNHDDPIVTAYRDHGHALARGMSPEACMAEMFGKIGGCAKGKGGSSPITASPSTIAAKSALFRWSAASTISIVSVGENASWCVTSDCKTLASCSLTIGVASRVAGDLSPSKNAEACLMC